MAPRASLQRSADWHPGQAERGQAPAGSLIASDCGRRRLLLAGHRFAMSRTLRGPPTGLAFGEARWHREAMLGAWFGLQKPSAKSSCIPPNRRTFVQRNRLIKIPTFLPPGGNRWEVPCWPGTHRTECRKRFCHWGYNRGCRHYCKGTSNADNF